MALSYSTIRTAAAKRVTVSLRSNGFKIEQSIQQGRTTEIVNRKTFICYYFHHDTVNERRKKN